MNSIVSVCITTYNRIKYLTSAINSVLTQTYKNFELLIVDDCSTDNTKEIIEEILKMDKRIKYFHHSSNMGLAAARNTAIFNATGKYFTFVDDDDIWLPNYLEEFVQLADNFTENYCFVCGSRFGKISLIPKSEEKLLKDYLLEGYTPPVASQFYFLTSLKKVNGYDTNIKSGVDHDLWFSLANHHSFKIKTLPKSLSEPNIKSEIPRMTTNIEARLKKIEESILIWKDKYEKKFPKDYFEFLSKNYRHYLLKRFLLTAFKQKKINQAISFFRQNPYKLRTVFFLISSIINKIKFVGKKIVLLTVPPSFYKYP